MLYLYNMQSKLTDEELYILYESLPSFRREKIHEYRKKNDIRNSIISYRLLEYAMMKEVGIYLRSQKHIWRYGKYGKPYLADFPNIHFSISHCSHAVLLGLSNDEIGVDVEDYIDTYDESLNFILSQREEDIIIKSKYPNQVFTSIWTLRESYMKYTGVGLCENISTMDVIRLGKISDLKLSHKRYEDFCFSSWCSKRLNVMELTKRNILEFYRSKEETARGEK